MEQLLSTLGLKSSIAQGSGAGGVVFIILSDGRWLRRSARAAGGVLAALYLTEGVMELTARAITVTPATERLGGLVFGLVGIYVAEGLVRAAKRLRDRAGTMAEKAAERAGL